MKSVASLSAAVALLSGTTDAFWRMPCHSRTALARLDPIVDRGVASSHGHVIHGGSSKYKQIPLFRLCPNLDRMNSRLCLSMLDARDYLARREVSCFALFN
jgi:hypothetical protein